MAVLPQTRDHAEKKTGHAIEQDRPDVLKRRLDWFDGQLDLDPDRPINGDWFEAYVRHVLIPTLRTGDVVIMDNLSSHKRASVRELIEAAGARLLFLPPYSPDFNPIEMAFSKLKAILRKAAERTVDGLWDTIGKLVDYFTPRECANYFATCGYDAD